MIKIKRYKGFSLVEILLSMVIISTVVILMLPIISKNTNKLKNIAKDDHAVFLYTQANNNNKDFPCYIANLNSSNNLVLKENTGKCEAHEFYIPKGIYKIDLTLVAGGGGGGGASGEITYKKDLTYKYTGPNYTSDRMQDVIQGRIKKAYIHQLVGEGAKGKNKNNIMSHHNFRSGDSGRRATAIIDYTVPTDKLIIGYNTYFLSEELEMPFEQTGTIGFIDNYTNINPTGLGSINGPGFIIMNGKTKTLTPEEWWNALIAGTVVGKHGKFIIRTQDAPENNTDIATAQCFDYETERKVEYWGWFPVGVKEENNNYTNIGDFKTNSAAMLAACNFTAKNFMDSNKITEDINKGKKMPDKIHTGFLLNGGEGERIFRNNSYGAGGKGESVFLTCKDSNIDEACNSNQFKIGNSISAEDPKNRYGKATITMAHPAGVGGGGVGGTAVKINGLAVVPGEKYTVVVGAGGEGGLKGKTGTLENSHKEYINIPTEGNKGTGGSSTAIYNENGDLLFMVAGGVGGNGGKVNSGVLNDWKNSSINPYNSVALPDMPTTARNIPLLIYDNEIGFDKLELDNAIIESKNDDATVTLGSEISGVKSERLVYRFMNEDLSGGKIGKVAPLYDLSLNSDKTSKRESVSTSDNDNKMGGFDKFRAPVATEIYTLNDTMINGVYNGLYRRYDPTKKELVYPGGLGGFSGLGTIAGCGGAFVGNSDGLINSPNISNLNYDSAYVGTFSITKSNGETETYSISNFYDNCNINTSDGQTAKFVAPSGSSIAGFNFGQAGAGGGGGGWSQSLGSGNGGAGQNGYVLINWR